MILSHNGTDITSQVISVQRNHNICSGVGSLSVSLKRTYSTPIVSYDTFVYYEDGIKKGTYFVSDITDNLSYLSISCQDITKQIADYYVSDFYEILTKTYSRYWIEKFLTEAQVPYNFNTTEQGHIMSDNTWVGNDLLMSIVQTLCVENGWYYYADADNVLQIGSLEVNLEFISAYLHDEEILGLQKARDDKMLRNRVIIRGNADPTTKEWVSAELKLITPWNYDENDYRTTMISSPNVYDPYDALHLANQLLNETKKITEVTTVSLAGFYDLHLGDMVFVASQFKRGVGRITNISSTTSNGGNTTELVLDQRCPRMYGYYSSIGDIYVGTWNDGVWKKPLKYDHTWSDFSTGIPSGDKSISSLAIANGVYACVGSEQLYTRTQEDTQWIKRTTSGISCTDCTVDRTNGDIYALMVSSGIYVVGSGILTDDLRTLYSVHNPATTQLYKYTSSGEEFIPITFSGDANFFGWNLDHDTKDLWISGVIPGSGVDAREKVFDDWGYIPSGFVSYRPFYVTWGDYTNNSLILHHPGSDPFIPPHPESRTTLANSVFAWFFSPDMFSQLCGQWIIAYPGIILRADSKLKVVAQKTRPNSLAFQIFTTRFGQPHLPDDFVLFTSPPGGGGGSFSHNIVDHYNPGNTLEGLEVFGFTWDIQCITDPEVDGREPATEVSISSITFENVDFIDRGNPSGKEIIIHGTRNIIAKYDGKDFTLMFDNLATPRKIETSQSNIILNYDNNVLDYVDQSDWSIGPINSSGVLTEARSVNELTLSGIRNRSYYTLTEERETQLYVADMAERTLSGWYEPVFGHRTGYVFSGLDAKLESSNYYDNPYMFASTFTTKPNFFQRDGSKFTLSGVITFEEHSTGLPDSRITVIRLDDRI